MTIKLSSLKANLEREKQGDWVAYPQWEGVSFNVSALTKPTYLAKRSKLFKRLAREAKGEEVPPDVLGPELGRLYAEEILHDWRGLDVAYSPEVALETLTDPAFRVVNAAVEYCAGQLSAIEAEFIEVAEKNFVPPSDGGSKKQRTSAS